MRIVNISNANQIAKHAPSFEARKINFKKVNEKINNNFSYAFSIAKLILISTGIVNIIEKTVQIIKKNFSKIFNSKEEINIKNKLNNPVKSTKEAPEINNSEIKNPLEIFDFDIEEIIQQPQQEIIDDITNKTKKPLEIFAFDIEEIVEDSLIFPIDNIEQNKEEEIINPFLFNEADSTVFLENKTCEKEVSPAQDELDSAVRQFKKSLHFNPDLSAKDLADLRRELSCEEVIFDSYEDNEINGYLFDGTKRQIKFNHDGEVVEINDKEPLGGIFSTFYANKQLIGVDSMNSRYYDGICNFRLNSNGDFVEFFLKNGFNSWFLNDANMRDKAPLKLRKI